ncbi:MAG: WG repeat-containing protein [Erysipelotrichaceae bacterium]|nr:WG repeat-containing protein [Erysipelotrichaceae bacterium]
MKKILVFVMAMAMLCGCSQNKTVTTFMLTRDNETYALYNTEGKQITENDYTYYKEVNVGYIIADTNEQLGVIDDSGNSIIEPGTYSEIESINSMFYGYNDMSEEATVDSEDTDSEDIDSEETTDEIEDRTGYLTDNLDILNSEGEVLYSASEDIQIMQSDLPVILENDTYTVLYKDGETLYSGTDRVSYVRQSSDGQYVLISFGDFIKFYYTDDIEETANFDLIIEDSGQYSIVATNDLGVILNDKDNESVIYVDMTNETYYQFNQKIESAYFDSKSNAILLAENTTYIYSVSHDLIELTSYYYSSSIYLQRSSSVYGPHTIYSGDTTITDVLVDMQLNPVVSELNSMIYPVYVKDQGYTYYDFEGNQAIDTYYLSAEAFDENGCAIVQRNDNSYVLIDSDGNQLTKSTYYSIKYIGSSYYAVYNDSGIFGVVNSNGEEVFAQEYTELPENCIVEVNNTIYLLLIKNGRTYVYDSGSDMEEVFSHEGNVILNPKGYFVVDNTYYTIDGEEIE